MEIELQNFSVHTLIIWLWAAGCVRLRLFPPPTDLPTNTTACGPVCSGSKLSNSCLSIQSNVSCPCRWSHSLSVGVEIMTVKFQETTLFAERHCICVKPHANTHKATERSHLRKRRRPVFSQDINLLTTVQRRVSLLQWEASDALHLAPYCAPSLC